MPPTPPSLGVPPRPQKSSKRPSTAPSSPTPSVFSSSPESHGTNDTSRVNGGDLIDTVPGELDTSTRLPSLEFCPFSAVVGDVDQNRQSVASDLTIRPWPSHTPTNVPNGNTRASSTTNLSRTVSHPLPSPSPASPLDTSSLTPFAFKVTAAVHSLNPNIPESIAVKPRSKQQRAVTLPQLSRAMMGLISREDIQTISQSPPDIKQEASPTGLERKSIPEEWKTSTAVRRQEQEGDMPSSGSPSRKSREDAPLEAGNVSQSRGFSRKSTSASAGIISHASNSPSPSGALEAGTTRRQLKRSNTLDVAGNGTSPSQSPGSLDPRQIAVERRERARNVWRARKMAQVSFFPL